MDDLEDPEVGEFAEPWAVEVTQAVPDDDGGGDVVDNEERKDSQDDGLGRGVCEVRRVQEASDGGLREEDHAGQLVDLVVVLVLESLGQGDLKGEPPCFKSRFRHKTS